MYRPNGYWSVSNTKGLFKINICGPIVSENNYCRGNFCNLWYTYYFCIISDKFSQVCWNDSNREENRGTLTNGFIVSRNTLEIKFTGTTVFQANENKIDFLNFRWKFVREKCIFEAFYKRKIFMFFSRTRTNVNQRNRLQFWDIMEDTCCLSLLCKNKFLFAKKANIRFRKHSAEIAEVQIFSDKGTYLSFIQQLTKFITWTKIIFCVITYVEFWIVRVQTREMLVSVCIIDKSNMLLVSFSNYK